MRKIKSLNMWYISLWTFSLGAIISSVLVITSVKAVNAIICLISAFINSIGTFILLGVDFIALIYCIVYVGAIAILFLFVIMLLNSNYPFSITQKGAKAEDRKRLSKSGVLNNGPLLFLICVLYILEIYSGLAQSTLQGSFDTIVESGVSPLFFKKSCIAGLGDMLYKECGYEILLVISLILLVGMIGSIVLTTTTIEPKTKG